MEIPFFLFTRTADRGPAAAANPGPGFLPCIVQSAESVSIAAERIVTVSVPVNSARTVP